MDSLLGICKNNENQLVKLLALSTLVILSREGEKECLILLIDRME